MEGISKQTFQAISSSLDSISSGISKAAQTNGIASLKDSIQLFGEAPKDAFSTLGRSVSKEIAQSGQIPHPENFFSKLSNSQWGDPHVREWGDPHVKQSGDPHVKESGDPHVNQAWISPSKIADQLKGGKLDLNRGMTDLQKSFQEKLNSIGDDAQLANVDMQNILQKQQQTLQMMSNISKMFYDTAMAVIRKLGG